MIKIYGMSTCPDCVAIEAQVKDNPRYEVHEIGSHVRELKAFLRMRDTEPAFDAVKRKGTVGIPCFVLEDGTVTLSAKAAGLAPASRDETPVCNIDGSGC